MKERRRSPRHAVENVRGTMYIAADARILNMSLTGMSVTSQTPMRVGKTYALTLRHGAGAELRLAGTVVWCHLRAIGSPSKGDPPPMYEAGIRFNDVLSDRAASLVHFLEESAMIAPNQRLAGRFTIASGQEVNLGTQYEFEVRSVSLSGMLIEADAAPEPDTIIEMTVKLDGTSLEARARVAFQRDVRTDDKRRITQIGVEYVDLSKECFAAIEKLIANNLG